MNRTRRPTDAWQSFAYTRGLRFVPPSAAFVNERTRLIEGIVEDVPLVVDTCMESSRDRFVTHTRVSGRAVAPAPTLIAVQSRLTRVTPAPGSLRGLGEPDFDERFFVKAVPAPTARLVLDDGTRLALVRFPKPLMFTYNAGEARVFWEGEEAEV